MDFSRCREDAAAVAAANEAALQSARRHETQRRLDRLAEPRERRVKPS
jgi:hypothetical protein